MNVDGKFKTGKLCILQDETQQPTDSNVYNFYFSDHMTIVIRNDNTEIIVLPPFMLQKAYVDNFNLTSYSACKQPEPLAKQLKSFLWNERFFALIHPNDASFHSYFDQETHNICIPLKEQTKYYTIDANTNSYEMKPKKNKITITPSTTLQKLVQQLPELNTNIKQAMKKVDNKIKFETEEDKECWNCGSCLDLTKLKFWENKEK